MTLPATVPETSMHEAYHLATGAALGVSILEVGRESDGRGWTKFEPPATDDVVENGIIVATYVMAPFLGGCSGVRRDLRKLAQFERWGIPIEEARFRCAKLITTPEFNALNWRFFDRLMQCPRLSAEDVREVLAS